MAYGLEIEINLAVFHIIVRRNVDISLAQLNLQKTDQNIILQLFIKQGRDN